jgi:sec-independent protein translocase protein TatA
MLDFSLDILGNEWVIIIFVAMMLFLGSKRLPDASRNLAKLVSEYNKTKNIVQTEIQKAREGLNSNIEGFTNPIGGPVMTEREKLEKLALSLNLEVIGKTEDELRDLVNSRMMGNSSKKESDTSTNP